MKVFPKFALLLLAILGAIISPSIDARPAPFHSIYYHRLQGSFWAQIADDTGPEPTPRELAIASVQDNFKAIRSLGFDTVTVGLPDSDSWVSQHGGGFSYDPKNLRAARPQFAVAQEIVLRIAEANDLKVIFAIGFSDYRRSSDGRKGWAGLADEYGSSTEPKGAYDYLHALFDPSVYYGNLTTTKLNTIGLADGTVRSHIDDTRIVGWNLAGEWNPNVVNVASKIETHEHTFKKYWNFFYELVHHGGASNAFAATYLIGQPGGGEAQVMNIKAFKQWFSPTSGIKLPDLIGVEFYGNGNYDLAAISKDLNKMIDAMETADPVRYPHDFAIPQDMVFLGEGGTSQTSSPAIGKYFRDVFQVLADRKLIGIQLWVSDTLGESKDASGKPNMVPITPAYDLFTTSFSPVGVRIYSPLPVGVAWHGSPSKDSSYADPANYPAYQDVGAAAYGKWLYTGLTDKGRLVQNVLTEH
jgi:hypothetical protein